MINFTEQIIKRFNDKIKITDLCHLWTAGDTGGAHRYGRIRSWTHI